MSEISLPRHPTPHPPSRSHLPSGKQFTVRSQLTRSLNAAASLEGEIQAKTRFYDFSGRKRLLNDAGLINSFLLTVPRKEKQICNTYCSRIQ